MMKLRNVLLLCMALLLISGAAGCGVQEASQPSLAAPATAAPTETPATAFSSETTAVATASPSETAATASPTEPTAEAEKNGEVYILFTSDIHCGIDEGFGLAGLAEVRDNLEAKGYTTLLVDDGDAIQGEPVGTLSRGESIVKLMNALGYDAAIPGNHEFDYGMERFLELTELAEYPYICCNFNRLGEPVFPPYIILEAAGLKIAFVGVTTPKTITSATPRYFQNEAGEYIYDFGQDSSGDTVYAAVQEAVDAARTEGADLVYVMGHLGMDETCRPWTYADIIEHTRGIDVFLDGHSHDTEQVVMKDLDGSEVTRSACGTKLNCIGYSHISSEGKILETGIWSWPNSVSAPELLGIKNDASAKVEAAEAEFAKQLDEVVAYTPYTLTIYDPKEADNSGNPIRMVRRAETNMGDLCADAYRVRTGADVAFVNGGSVRADIAKGDITYGDILNVHPFGNMICVIELSGQQILDALEWGARAVPDQNGSFLQVSGLSYEIDVSIESGCMADEKVMLVSIQGERRVKNVQVGGEPIDPEKKYTLAGNYYMLMENGDGYTMFKDAPLLQDRVQLDNQMLIDYITEDLGGEISAAYADPYGQGRIVILQEET